LEREHQKPSPVIRAMNWFLGIAFVILVIGCAGAYYIGYKMWNPPPSHFQDLDRLTEETKTISNLFYLSESIDHVYIYREHRIFGDTYLRYHFIRAEDFEKHRKSAERSQREENRKRAEQSQQEENGQGSISYRGQYAITWENTANAPEEIRSWWACKSQPHFELFGTMEYYEVYDVANNIVYVYRSGD
jgi:hypothetical protein